MKVIHLDEHEARRVLEACRVAQRLVHAAEELVGHETFLEDERMLRRAVGILEDELGIEQLKGDFEEQAKIRRSVVS